MSDAIEKHIRICPSIKKRCDLGGRIDRMVKRMVIIRLLEKKLSRRYAKSTARRYARAMTMEIQEILDTDLSKEVAYE